MEVVIPLGVAYVWIGVAFLIGCVIGYFVAGFRHGADEELLRMRLTGQVLMGHRGGRDQEQEISESQYGLPYRREGEPPPDLLKMGPQRTRRPRCVERNNQDVRCRLPDGHEGDCMFLRCPACGSWDAVHECPGNGSEG